jgi:RNA polymerase sigma-70 factor (ECF subfamily)
MKGFPAADPDAQLVDRAKAGDYAAFEQLVTRHERHIYGLAVSILRNREDAEEASQKTFLSALEHLPSFRGDSAFGGWISRIAANASLEIIRKRKNQVELADDSGTISEDGLPKPVFIADWTKDPVELAERAETREILDRALDSLEEKYRAIFVLRDVEGMATEESAKMLGISVANAKVRLLRARLLLREKLTAVFGDPATRPTHEHHHE